MKELIKNELIVNKKYFFIVLLLLPVYLPMMLFVEGLDKKYIGFIFTISFFAYFTSSSIIEAEDKKNTHLLYGSLAIFKEDIVKSKYFLHGLFPLFSSIVLYSLTSIINYYTPYKDISVGLEVLIIALSLALIIQAIIIPVHNMGGKIIYLIMVLLFGGIYVGVMFRVMDYERDLLLGINYGILSIVVSILAVFSYFLSMRISIKILKEGLMKE